MGGGWLLTAVHPQLLVSAVNCGGRCGGPSQTRKVATLAPKALKAQARSAPSTFA
jgi:hypothetical protein